MQQIFLATLTTIYYESRIHLGIILFSSLVLHFFKRIFTRPRQQNNRMRQRVAPRNTTFYTTLAFI